MQIHRCALRGAFPQSSRLLAWSVIALSALIWPLRSLWLIALHTRSFGPEIRRNQRKSLFLQTIEQLRLAWLHSISPKSYYTYKFHQKENSRKALHYLYDDEIKSLLPFLNKYQSTEILDNKLDFLRLCERNGLSTTSNVAIAQKGKLTLCEEFRNGLPEKDIFIKPIYGYGGRMALSWEYQNGFYRCSKWQELNHLGVTLPKKDGFAIVSIRDFPQLVEKLSWKQSLLLQLRAQNHASLAHLSDGSLISARVLTGYGETGAELIRATLKIPLPGHFTNNRGLIAPIHEKTGAVGDAINFGALGQSLDDQVWSQTHVSNISLPDWSEAVALAVCAHQLLPQFAFIGWDVAFCVQGPILLEGNWGWGIEALQKAHESPLTDTRFTPVCLHRIQQIKRERAAP